MTDCALEEAKIFFHPAEFTPRVEEIKAAVNALVYAGTCTGASLERLISGEIRLFFNPIYHTTANRHEAIRVIEEVVKKSAVTTLPEDSEEESGAI